MSDREVVEAARRALGPVGVLLPVSMAMPASIDRQREAVVRLEGVGYAQQAEEVGRSYGHPVDTMRDYLRRMEGPTWVPAPEASYPRIIAANGPKMLALAADVADGALPAGQSREAIAARLAELRDLALRSTKAPNRSSGW